MRDDAEPVLIYTTWPDRASALAGARVLVGQGHVACANVMPGGVSVYEWDGAVHEDDECVMVLKTVRGKAEAAIAAFVTTHPYDVPAAVVVPVAGGHAPFLDWVREQTGDAPAKTSEDARR